MEKINGKHLMFIIWGLIIVSIKTNINVFIRDGGRDSWITITIASFITLFFLLYCVKTSLLQQDLNLVKIYRKSVGNFFGNIFLFFFVLTLLLTLIEAASVEANSMHTNMLIETPVWYFSIFFIIPAIYTVKKGLTPVIFVAIIGIILAMLAGINLVILTSKYKNYSYLLPIMKDGVTPGLIRSLIKALGFYGNIIILLPFFSFVKEKKSIKKYCLVAVLIVIQMHIVSVVGAIASYGAERVVNISYPKLNQTQEINYFGFLESGELFVMFQIIGGWFVKYVITFFALLKIIKEMNINNKYLVYVISLIVFILTYYPATNIFFLNKFLNFYAYICLLNYMIIPFIIFTIFKFRNKENTSA
jgi:spore germination protein (amino acid permease)